MRGALSIIGLVIVFAIVMISAKNQMAAVKPSAPASVGSSSSNGSSTASPSAANPRSPQAVGQQVQELMQQGEQRASEAGN